MKRNERVVTMCVSLACLFAACGCDEIATDASRFFDPTAMIKAPERQPINMIRSSMSVADETQEILPNATPPREEDYVYTKTDYVIGPTDVVNVTIQGLSGPDSQDTLPREVSDSGYIDMPYLSQRIKADGMTQEELKDAIIKGYTSTNILRDPQVSVSVVSRRQNTFSIMGAVGRTGTYNVLRRDMRLLEALALAGDISQTNIRYLYVFRMQPAISKAGPAERKGPGGGSEELGPLPPEVIPGARPGTPGTAPAPLPASGAATTPSGIGSASPASNPQTDIQNLEHLLPGPAKAPPATLPAPSRVKMLTETGPSSPATTSSAPAAAVRSAKWMFTNGKWVREDQQGRGDESEPSPATQDANPVLVDATDPFNWSRVQKKDLTRIIAINVQTLKSGNPLMNIVVRDNDVIQVPPPDSGEFYLMGEIARPGVYALTGRQVTVKMAVAAGGNLGANAWPRNSILIRRVGYNQEQVIPLDIQAIFRGDASDVFMKADDLLAVGTDIRAPFFAVIRNAFRLSYGFGFVYDRNFAEAAPVGLTHTRFTRW